MPGSFGTFVRTADDGASACTPVPSVGVATRQTGQAWNKLTWPHRLVVLGTIAGVAALAVPRLPPGLCFGDSGDLQVASATLGIAHPPGYGGYVSLAYLLTLIPGIDPAYTVSLACCGSGLVAIALGMLLQVRLGLSPWIAAATGLLLAMHPRVWVNLVAPEVYAPSLALLVGAAYLLIKYAQLGRRRDLWLAAALFGVVAANRTPVLPAALFLGVASWMANRRWKPTGRARRATVPIALGLVALPFAYSAGYVWLRDAPGTPHNAIEHFTPMNVALPPPAGPQAKAERLWWLVSGSPFRSLMGNDWDGVRAKLIWLYRELRPSGTVAPWMLLMLVPVGLIVAIRRCPESAWALVGPALASAVFVCVYRLVGQAADLLPLLWALAVLAGVGLSPLFPRNAGRWRERLAVAAFALTCTWTAAGTGTNRAKSPARDATGYLVAMDLATLPPNAVVVTADWDARLPICYAKHVLTNRADVSILGWKDWDRSRGKATEGPVFFANDAELPDGFRLVPYRNLWRVERSY